VRKLIDWRRERRVNKTMYNSTKEYVKIMIKKLMDQCDITIYDIQKAVDEIRHPLGTKGYHDVDEYYKE